MSNTYGETDQLCVNAIRMLAVDMVEAAKSGHPGMPLGAAPMGYVLFSKIMNHNPANPGWLNRDRFVLSAGHGSALIYGLLHLSGYDLPLDELKNFRQWGSRTPGHPERGHVPGVEATTGPLGQGFAMGVGMAMAEANLAARYNRPGHEVIDHYTYAIVSDGDLMEGISHEAASLAGSLGLGKLVYLYDDNSISIEGSTDLAFTESVPDRFRAYGWQVLTVDDGNDLAAIEAAVLEAKQEATKPSLICVKTHIGYGSPKQDSSSAHGEPLGPEATIKTKEFFNWPTDKPFHIPQAAAEYMGMIREDGINKQIAWQEVLEDYREANPAEGAELAAMLNNRLPEDWAAALPTFTPDQGPMATRAASGACVQPLAAALPGMMGGSADLAPSNKTWINDSADFGQDRTGRNIHFGVRELAMGAIVNGMALHGGLIPYGGTFLVFADYMRPAVRLAALMQTKSIFVFTHDSLGVGEDGPTHQPVEQVMSLRVIPGLNVIRPAEANETALAWKAAVEADGPTALILTRQKLPILEAEAVQGAAKGGYILAEGKDMIIIAAGSEVSLALEAREALAEKGVSARVVSLPCREIFEVQPADYRAEVLPPAMTKRLVVEAGVSLGWEGYAGSDGTIIGVDRFGASAPGGLVLSEYGFNKDNIVAQAMKLLG